MKKNLIFLFITLLSFSVLYAQEEERLKGEFYLTSDFGLMLGTINRIEVSPALGYYFNDRFTSAVGIKYEFYSETRLYANQETVKTHIYGPRMFARYTIFKNLGEFLPIGINTALFVHSEFESNSLERRYFDYPRNSENGRFWYIRCMVGATYRRV